MIFKNLKKKIPNKLKSTFKKQKDKVIKETAAQQAAGLAEAEATATAEALVGDWVKAEELLLAQRYEQELMNPDEALSLGSISQIVMPSDLRQVLAEHMDFCLRHYEPSPLQSVQREFH